MFTLYVTPACFRNHIQLCNNMIFKLLQSMFDTEMLPHTTRWLSLGNTVVNRATEPELCFLTSVKAITQQVCFTQKVKLSFFLMKLGAKNNSKFEDLVLANTHW